MLTRKDFPTLIIALIGFILIQFFTKHGGLGLSPDSICYLSTADALTQGYGFLQFDHRPMILFPFGYPVFLSILKILTRYELLEVMPIVNGFLFAVVIFLCSKIADDLNANKWIKFLLLSLITTSPALTEVYFMMWSETLFILEILLFFLFAKKYLIDFSIQSLLLFSFLAAIAFDTRYAGLTLVVTGGTLILGVSKMDWIKKIKHILIFGSISSFFVTLNLLRNYYYAESFTGIRQAGFYTLNQNMTYFGSIIYQWFPFLPFIKKYENGVGYLFMLTFFFIFIYKFFKKTDQNLYIKIASTFTFIYSLLIIVTSTVSRYEEINSRLLAPLYISCFVTLFFYAISCTKNKLISFFKLGWTLLFLSIGLITLKNYIQVDYDIIKQVNDTGIGGYNEDSWKQNSLIQCLISNPSILAENKFSYSNVSPVIYLYTKKPVWMLPEKQHLTEVYRFFKNAHITLVWFKDEVQQDGLKLEEIKRQFHLIPIYSFKEGTIYDGRK